MFVDYITKQLKEYRSLIAPIRKLPVELLSEIFISTSRIEDLVLVKITEVCRQWRQVVLATPKAWSRVWFHNDLPEERSLIYISTFLERGGRAQPRAHLPFNFDPSYHAAEHPIYSLLHKSPHRIRCLSICDRQIPLLNTKAFFNVVRLSFYNIDGYSWGYTRGIVPSDVDISKFPRLEAINSLEALWLATPSPDRFPNLLRLSLRADTDSVWLKIIKCTALTLESLVISCFQVYDVPGDFSIDLPVLKSLGISNLSRNAPWSARITTLSLIS